MPYLHLTPGAAVVPDDGTILLVTADEQFAVVTGSSDEIPGLRAVLRGSSPVPETGTAAEVASAIVEWGAATTGAAPPLEAAPWSLVELVDDGGLAPALGQCLGATEPVALAVSDVLDDADLDRQDRRRSGPWLPVHRELGNLVVGPVLALPAGEPAGPLTWADVRFRRLAASPAPTQLRKLWDHWSEQGAADDVLPAADRVRSAVDRLREWLPGRTGLLARHQLVVALYDDRAPSAHPVLPVPGGLMAQVPA